MILTSTMSSLASTSSSSISGIPSVTESSFLTGLVATTAAVFIITDSFSIVFRTLILEKANLYSDLLPFLT